MLIHGIYYAIAGIWPLLHLKSFLLVTGSKRDLWLVKQVGLLAFAAAIVMFVGYNSSIDNVLYVHVIAFPITFLIVDVYYSLKGIISNVYLVDAMIQLALIIAYSTIIILK